MFNDGGQLWKITSNVCCYIFVVVVLVSVLLLLFFVFDFPLFWSLVNCFLGGDRFTDGNRRCNLSIACLSFAGRKTLSYLLTLSLIGEIECNSLCAMIGIRHFCHGSTDKQQCVTTNSSLCTFLYSCRGWGVVGGTGFLCQYFASMCACIYMWCACVPVLCLRVHVCVCVGRGWEGGGGGGCMCVRVSAPTGLHIINYIYKRLNVVVHVTPVRSWPWFLLYSFCSNETMPVVAVDRFCLMISIMSWLTYRLEPAPSQRLIVTTEFTACICNCHAVTYLPRHWFHPAPPHPAPPYPTTTFPLFVPYFSLPSLSLSLCVFPYS